MKTGMDIEVKMTMKFERAAVLGLMMEKGIALGVTSQTTVNVSNAACIQESQT